jgi:hypothetical protein
MLSINITGPDLAPEIKRLSSIDRQVSGTAILKAAGKQLEIDLRDHFSARNQEPNKQGWPKKNFWAGIAEATALASVSDNEATVSVSDPAINQKVFGGTIKPKPGRNLTIPQNAEAYTAGSPRNLPANFLRLLVTRSGKVYLVENDPNLRPRGKKGYKPGMSFAGRFWYRLVPSVTQAPDPRALPEESYLEGSVMSAIRGVFDAQIKKNISVKSV